MALSILELTKSLPCYYSNFTLQFFLFCVQPNNEYISILIFYIKYVILSM